RLLLMSLKNCSVITMQSFVALSSVVKTQSLKSHYWRKVLKKNVRVKLNVKKHNTLKTLLKRKENITWHVFTVVASSAALQLRTLRPSTTKISTLYNSTSLKTARLFLAVLQVLKLVTNVN